MSGLRNSLNCREKVNGEGGNRTRDTTIFSCDPQVSKMIEYLALECGSQPVTFKLTGAGIWLALPADYCGSSWIVARTPTARATSVATEKALTKISRKRSRPGYGGASTRA
jgi:hypothetical protein